jgi:hypothetical protein
MLGVVEISDTTQEVRGAEYIPFESDSEYRLRG